MDAVVKPLPPADGPATGPARHGVLRQMAAMMRLCLAGPGGRLGIPLYGLVLALELAQIAISLRLIAWTKAFYDALQQMDAAEALRQVGIFAVIVVIEISRYLVALYLRKTLEIRWRQSLTSVVLDRWLAGRAYLRTSQTADGGQNDNPDQRIAEDCRIFIAGPANDHGSATGMVPLSLDLISNIVGLFSYVAVLWGLSSFPLDLSFIGVEGELPRYMVWAAFVYVALSSGVTHLLGRPLKQLYFNQQRREADYRFALVRVRENADAVALSRGEASERAEIDRRFGAIVINWRRIISRELVLFSFTYPFRFTVFRIPTFLALPAYFAGSLTFGGLMQLGNAFSQVVTTLAWFIFAYRPLAELAAATSRLGRFVESLEAEPADSAIQTEVAADARLGVRGLALATPAGRALASVPQLSVAKGETLWLRGPSGIGKTTFVKALAGVWRHGRGTIATPDASALFLPQLPYLPIGGIAEAVAYPGAARDFDAATLADALERAGLDPARLAAPDGLDGLSGGERQRVALARLFVHRPDWVFLDEATSALDHESEAAVLSELRRALPESGFVVVAHRKPDGLGPLRILDLGAGRDARLTEPA